MADQEGTVIGYPTHTFSYHQPQPTTSTVTATATHNTPTTSPFTTRNQPNTNISSNTPTTTNKDNITGCIIIISLVLCLSAGLIGLFVFLAQSYPIKFEVNSVIVYPFNISSSYITANWNIIFSITNPISPNSVSYYDDTWVSVFYKEKNISSTAIGSFLQADDGNERLMQANIVASSVNVNNSIARDIVADWSHGAVNFTVTVSATTRTDPGTTHEIRELMTVSCEDVKVGFLLNMTIGMMLGGSKECSVSLQKLK